MSWLSKHDMYPAGDMNISDLLVHGGCHWITTGSPGLYFLLLWLVRIQGGQHWMSAFFAVTISPHTSLFSEANRVLLWPREVWDVRVVGCCCLWLSMFLDQEMPKHCQGKESTMDRDCSFACVFVVAMGLAVCSEVLTKEVVSQELASYVLCS